MESGVKKKKTTQTHCFAPRLFVRLRLVEEIWSTSVHMNVFVQATKVNSLAITDVAMAEDLLRHADKIIPCKGFGEEGEFSPNPKRKEKTHGGKVFSASCFGVAQSAKQVCPQCKYLRKLLQNQASYRKRALPEGCCTSGGLARKALPRLLDLRRVELDTREEIVCAHLSPLATESRLVHDASGHWNDVIKKRKTLYD
ncbi:hypothetical protein MRX96_000369 [Rhipicephalus microplus]